MDIIKYEKFNNIFAVDCFDKEFEQLFIHQVIKDMRNGYAEICIIQIQEGKTLLTEVILKSSIKMDSIYIQSVIQGVKLTHVLSFILQQKTIT